MALSKTILLSFTTKGLRSTFCLSDKLLIIEKIVDESIPPLRDKAILASEINRILVASNNFSFSFSLAL